MATLKFKGLEEYVAQLERLSNNTDEVIGKAVYEGADIVADAIRNGIGTIPVDDKYHKKGDMRNGLRSVEIAGLRDGFGIAKMRKDKNFTNVKLGFHEKNKMGRSNATTARMIESGNSYTRKKPFVRQAVNSTKAACEAKMKQVIEDEISKLMK